MEPVLVGVALDENVVDGVIVGDGLPEVLVDTVVVLLIVGDSVSVVVRDNESDKESERVGSLLMDGVALRDAVGSAEVVPLGVSVGVCERVVDVEVVTEGVKLQVEEYVTEGVDDCDAEIVADCDWDNSDENVADIVELLAVNDTKIVFVRDKDATVRLCVVSVSVGFVADGVRDGLRESDCVLEALREG